MKKLVLVAALFMFFCGGTFLAQAKAPVEQPSKTTTLSNDTVVTDTLQKAKNVPPQTNINRAATNTNFFIIHLLLGWYILLLSLSACLL